MDCWPGKIRRSLEAGHPYEANLLEHVYAAGFHERHHEQRAVAVDAGANIGNHTLWFAAICDLDVVAFEPLYPAELAHNVALNGLQERVQVHGVCLGAGSCGAGDDVAAHQGKGRMLVGSGTFPVRTLDSYQIENVALVKADVEGMEAQVLSGGEQTIRRDRPVIFAEEWGLREHDAVARVVEPWGYRMTEHFRTGGSTVVGRWELK